MIIDALKNNKTLKSLNLRSGKQERNKMNDYLMKEIQKGNKIGNHGIKVMSELLKTNETIAELNLSCD